MGRRLSCLWISLILLPTSAPATVGIFESNQDIDPAGTVGTTEFVGMVDRNGMLVEQYLVTGYGSGGGSARDRFQFAYRTLSGDWRVSADFKWDDKPPDAWSKMGVMIRASTADDAVQYDTIVPNYVDGANVRTDTQWQAVTGGEFAEEHVTGRAAGRLGIQRVYLGGEIPAMEGLADFGSGWERIGSLKILTGVADRALFGVAVASHAVFGAATARVTDVVYERSELVGPAPAITMIPAGSAKAFTGRENGFVIRTLKVADTVDWGRDQMDKLLDGALPGQSEGQRVSQFVNLHDSGGRGVFSAANGFPDRSFPGIDLLESPTQNPAGGDDDDNFAAEVLAVIHLTSGLHVLGVNGEDGTIVKVGGVEIGRTDEWKDASTTDFLFQVRQEGFYTLRVRHLAGPGASALELHEVVKTADGSWKRVLLGDVAEGGSAVYVPEPATIALLGLGALALLRRQRAEAAR